MKDQDPTTSLCWSCEHGICFSQTHREILFAEMDDSGSSEENEDNYDLGLTDFDQPGTVDPHKGHVHQVEKHSVCSVCNWQQPPLMLQIVHKCNRFKARDAE